MTQKEKPYILVAKNDFQLNCNGWELFLALKVLFVNIEKKDKTFHDLLCKKLIDCGAFTVPVITKKGTR